MESQKRAAAAAPRYEHPQVASAALTKSDTDHQAATEFALDRRRPRAQPEEQT